MAVMRDRDLSAVSVIVALLLALGVVLFFYILLAEGHLKVFPASGAGDHLAMPQVETPLTCALTWPNGPSRMGTLPHRNSSC